MLKISILPLLVVLGFAVADFQPGNGKGQGKKENHGHDKGNRGKGHDRWDDRGRDHRDDGKGRGVRGRGDRDSREWRERQDHRGNGKNDGKGRRDDFWGKGPKHAFKKGKPGHFHMNKGKGNREVILWRTDNSIDWGFGNFPGRRRPNDYKKVTLCHQTGNRPVTISVSENALRAHLNHGDRIGNCGSDYGVWTPRYIRKRENVYNVYEQSWERMSYSEALLSYAMERLLGLRTDLRRDRARLSPKEIRRREILIYDLENNVNGLQTSLAGSRSTMNGININLIL